MSIFRASVFAQPAWKAFPALTQFALDHLRDSEAFELLRVLQTMPNHVNDSGDIDRAFFWHESPQGEAYWQAISERLAMQNSQLDQNYPVDPLFIEAESSDFKGPTGWEPDVVDGEHAMNITRDMF